MHSKGVLKLTTVYSMVGLESATHDYKMLDHGLKLNKNQNF